MSFWQLKKNVFFLTMPCCCLQKQTSTHFSDTHNISNTSFILSNSNPFSLLLNVGPPLSATINLTCLHLPGHEPVNYFSNANAFIFDTQEFYVNTSFTHLSPFHSIHQLHLVLPLLFTLGGNFKSNVCLNF